MTEGTSVAWIGLLGLVTAPVIGAVMHKIVNGSAKKIIEQNTSEHLINKTVLDRIESKVDANSELLSEHLSWHIEHPIPNESAA